MIKLNYDRTDTPPIAPSWASAGGGTVPISLQQHAAAEGSAPWLAHVFEWMAGRSGNTTTSGLPPLPLLETQDMATIIAHLQETEWRPQPAVLRAAFDLAAASPPGVASQRVVRWLLAALPADATDDSPATASPSADPMRKLDGGGGGWSTSFEGWGLVMAIAAMGEKAVPTLLEELHRPSVDVGGAKRGKNDAKRKALLLDLLLDCGRGGGSDDHEGEEGGQRRRWLAKARIDCFIAHVSNPEPWVRHSAVQALELSAGNAVRMVGKQALWKALTPLLLRDPSSDDEFVVWNAISALWYAANSGRDATSLLLGRSSSLREIENKAEEEKVKEEEERERVCLLRDLLQRLRPLGAENESEGSSRRSGQCGSAFVMWKAQETGRLIAQQLEEQRQQLRSRGQASVSCSRL